MRAEQESRLTAALLRARQRHMWRGSVQERKAKHEQLHAEACDALGLSTSLAITVDEDMAAWTRSFGSSYSMPKDRITLRGRLSVVTHLHELGHAYLQSGDEGKVQAWAVRHFKSVWPKSYERNKHLIVGEGEP
jgi:hypothetical protein